MYKTGSTPVVKSSVTKKFVGLNGSHEKVVTVSSNPTPGDGLAYVKATPGWTWKSGDYIKAEISVLPPE
jgi:hypothetical protein